MTKPKEIIELERLYGVELTHKDKVKWNVKNYYSLDANGNVTVINLRENNIKSIKGFDKFTSLQELNLSRNQITKIENLEALSSLQKLYLSNNQIIKIENLEELSSLQTVNLSNNQIIKIENLEALSRLKTLDLSYNQIIKIENLEALSSLQTLYLFSNQITKIENLEVILSQKWLKELRIYNNPFEKELGDTKLNQFSNNLETFRNHFNLRNASDKQEVAIIQKIMLVGNHSSGKSTFLHYFFSDNFKREDKSTHILNIENYERKAMFYDFGGQDYYHGIYKAFMSNSALNLIFWKKEIDDNRLGKDNNGGKTQNFNRGYWIKQVGHYGDDNKSWLIQTHLDQKMNKRNALTDDTLQELIEDEYHISLSGKPKANLKALKENLEERIKESGKEQISASYIQFLNEYIFNQTSHKDTSVSELEAKFKNVADIDFRAQMYNLSLQGLVLYYKDHPKLKNVIWLNPQATVEYIHKNVFEKKKMQKYKGDVPKDEFESMCDENIRSILLVNKVIYLDTTESGKHKYIIPSYLPRANEDGNEFFYFTNFSTPSLTLKFEYFIPFGFINQLICHYGNLEERKIYWRDMLLFTIDKTKTKVLIKLNFEALKIEIYVISKDSDARAREVSRHIFDDIGAFYCDVPKYGSKLLPKRKLEKNNESEIRDSKNLMIIYPNDMYISLDNRYFVHYNTLNNHKETKESIVAFALEEESNKLIKNNPKIHSTREFAYFAPDNKELKKMKKIFVSYSRKDSGYRDELRKHLELLSTLDIADNWACEDMEIGRWHTQIQKELEESDIVIYMLSANFFSSPYIRENEVLTVMKQIKSNPRKKILPVIVSEFVGLDTLKQSIQNPTEVQEAILDISNHQYLPYGNVLNHLLNQNEEKIISLEEHSKNRTLNSALAQICRKIAEYIGV